MPTSTPQVLAEIPEHTEVAGSTRTGEIFVMHDTPARSLDDTAEVLRRLEAYRDAVVHAARPRLHLAPALGIIALEISAAIVLYAFVAFGGIVASGIAAMLLAWGLVLACRRSHLATPWLVGVFIALALLRFS